MGVFGSTARSCAMRIPFGRKSSSGAPPCLSVAPIGSGKAVMCPVEKGNGPQPTFGVASSPFTPWSREPMSGRSPATSAIAGARSITLSCSVAQRTCTPAAR